MTPKPPAGDFIGNTPRQAFASMVVITRRSFGLAGRTGESLGIDAFSNEKVMAGMGKEEVGGKVRRD